ncbi:hypothetical protein TanjilG_25212 [Lupinus angustifolius]|uniref:FAS1 domain-containing protein n=1 Tax=Lupinus angustifolius TaxID=3871 RepID=A0A1J7GKR9_LUPAN|nr:PREDICTED: fasciclin-like arabinogalactan protein 10 [Lupinus angustifolius]OIW01104.1 hypothetical protein TanjilG_25212 [Lupinus angustifolius]
MGLSIHHHLLLLLLSLSVVATTVSAYNITDILSSYPNYTDFNRLLTQTKIADEINGRQTLTVLVLPNSIFSPVAASHPLSVVKKVLSLHVLLDYFDQAKLHQLSNGSTITTTLFQTTGTAEKNNGLVNITDFKDGSVGFGSAAPNSTIGSNYTKSVKQIPYSISIIEINAPIVAPGFLTAPPPVSDVDLTALLESHGAKTFSSLIQSSGVIKTFHSIADKGLTIFAPSDEGFKEKDLPDLSKLTSDEVVTLLKYHATASYLPLGSLKIFKGPISTLASTGAGKFELTVSVKGGSVKLLTGTRSSRIADNILDSPLISIFTVDRVLIPKDPLSKPPAPAPAPKHPPPPPSHSPAPGHSAHSPDGATPPAPGDKTPEVAPVSPAADGADHGSQKGVGVHVKGGAVLSLVAFVIASIFMH